MDLEGLGLWPMMIHAILPANSLLTLTAYSLAADEVSPSPSLLSSGTVTTLRTSVHLSY
jgi:hypothetical protein